MADCLQAPIVILHAMNLAEMDLDADSDSAAVIRNRLHEKLACFPDAEFAGIPVTRKLVEGPAAACIVNQAVQMDAPLIMLATRGHTRFRQLLLGSVTAAVLHDALCPVWTEAHVETPPPERASCRSLVCAVDMGPQTPHVLRGALEFGDLFGAKVHVVHSIPRGDQRFVSGPSTRAHILLIDDAREKYDAHCSAAGVRLPLEILDQFWLADGIAGAVAKHSADLLVIGRGVIQGTLGRLRSNAHELIRRSPCPVLSF